MSDRSTFWRRRTGLLGFTVEVFLWLAVVTFALNLLSWALRLLTWLLVAAR